METAPSTLEKARPEFQLKSWELIQPKDKAPKSLWACKHVQAEKQAWGCHCASGMAVVEEGWVWGARQRCPLFQPFLLSVRKLQLVQTSCGC